MSSGTSLSDYTLGFVLDHYLMQFSHEEQSRMSATCKSINLKVCELHRKLAIKIIKENLGNISESQINEMSIAHIRQIAFLSIPIFGQHLPICMQNCLKPYYSEVFENGQFIKRAYLEKYTNIIIEIRLQSLGLQNGIKFQAYQSGCFRKGHKLINIFNCIFKDGKWTGMQVAIANKIPIDITTQVPSGIENIFDRVNYNFGSLSGPYDLSLFDRSRLYDVIAKLAMHSLDKITNSSLEKRVNYPTTNVISSEIKTIFPYISTGFFLTDFPRCMQTILIPFYRTHRSEIDEFKKVQRKSYLTSNEGTITEIHFQKLGFSGGFELQFYDLLNGVSGQEKANIFNCIFICIFKDGKWIELQKLTDKKTGIEQIKIPVQLQDIFDKMDLIRDIAWGEVDQKQDPLDKIELILFPKIFKSYIDPKGDTELFFDVACQAMYRLNRVFDEPINETTCEEDDTIIDPAYTRTDEGQNNSPPDKSSKKKRRNCIIS